jgi:hypothetical protein
MLTISPPVRDLPLVQAEIQRRQNLTSDQRADERHNQIISFSGLLDELLARWLRR